MFASVKVGARTEEGIPTPADPLLEGTPSDPLPTILKMVDLGIESTEPVFSDPPFLGQGPVVPVSPSFSPSPLSFWSSWSESSSSSSTFSAFSSSPSSPPSLSTPSSPLSSMSPSSPSFSSSPLFSSSSPSPTFSSSSTSTTFLSAVSDTKTLPSSTFIFPSSSTSAIKPTLLNENAVIGGVVGGVVGLLIMTALITYYLIRRSHRRKMRDLAHVTTFEVSPDKSIEPASRSKLKADPHPSAPNAEVLTANLPFISDSNTTRPILSDAGQNIDETMDQTSPDTAVLQRDSLVDQSMSHPHPASPERVQSTLPIISHSRNSSNLNPLLREILNVTQGRSQGSSDPGQNIQIFIISQPSNTNGAVTNEDGENRGDHYGRYLPRNMDSDTLSLPPSYE